VEGLLITSGEILQPEHFSTKDYLEDIDALVDCLFLPIGDDSEVSAIGLLLVRNAHQLFEVALDVILVVWKWILISLAYIATLLVLSEYFL
jgi:hypothetical protein